MTHRSVIEAGPATIRRVCCDTGDSPVSAALISWLDEPFALVGGQPVGVSELLSQVLSCPRPAVSIEIVHPSWWPARRVALFTDAARGLSGAVCTRPRAAVLGPGAVVVEIAHELVAVVAASGEVIAEPRLGPPEEVAAVVARRVVEVAGPLGDAVVIDAPAQIGGAAALAELISDRLHPQLPVRVLREFPSIGRDVEPGPTPALRRRWRAPVVAVAGVLAMVSLPRHDVPREPEPDVRYVVQGQVAVQVPADWPARQVTGGPGSVRVEVVSPSVPQLSLHLTEAPAIGDTLAVVAEGLQRVLEQAQERSPGVFVDFQAVGTSAGRPAVTYRELRDGHHVDWTVWLDGTVRIGIGCQSGPDGDEVLRPVCERAVRSAHVVR